MSHLCGLANGWPLAAWCSATQNTTLLVFELEDSVDMKLSRQLERIRFYAVSGIDHGENTIADRK